MIPAPGARLLRARAGPAPGYPRICLSSRETLRHRKTPARADRARPGDTIEMLPDNADTIIDEPGDELVQQLYHELRGLAAGILRRLPPGGATLQPTALVHEAYERLCRQPDRRWQGRQHFYRAAARAMRHLLIERARARKAVRHGGEWQRHDVTVTLGGPDDAAVLSREELLDLDRALRKLQRAYPALVELVHMRYFCGLTVPEIAELQGVSVRTVERDWSFARAWLCSELGRSAP